MRIIGPPSVSTLPFVLANLPTSATMLFREQIAPALWDEAKDINIDPVGVIAQSFKETGGGTFRGMVTPQFYNTAGIKVRHVGKFPGIDDGDRPLAHAQFSSWVIGARAHVQHLCAYAGQPVYDVDVVDPRYWLVAGKHKVENFEELSGKWAPSPTYGAELVAIARRLQGSSA